MSKRKPKGEFYVVLTPEKQIEVYATAQEAGDRADITRNTLKSHIDKFGSYSKHSFLIVLRNMPKKFRRGKPM